MLSSVAFERTLPQQTTNLTLQYHTQSIWWAPKRWCQTALLFGASDVGRTLPNTHCHFVLAMWRSCHPDTAVMAAN